MGKKSRKPRGGGGGGAKPSPPTGPFDGPLVDGVTNIMSYAMMVAEDAKGDITTERAYSGACLSRDVPSCDECWLEGVPLKLDTTTMKWSRLADAPEIHCGFFVHVGDRLCSIDVENCESDYIISEDAWVPDRKLAALPIWHKVHMVEPDALSLAI